jgi:hypothetical protein
MVLNVNLLDLPERLQSKILPEPNSGCWIWMGAVAKRGGYGSVGIGSRRDPAGRMRMQKAHRVVYEMLRGAIPEALQIDHKCRTTCCVNPDHLEPVTARVNILRGHTLARANAEKTHCKRGHEFTPENTYVQSKRNGRLGRACRTCVIAAAAASKARARQRS